MLYIQDIGKWYEKCDIIAGQNWKLKKSQILNLVNKPLWGKSTKNVGIIYTFIEWHQIMSIILHNTVYHKVIYRANKK